ncbi:MAG: glycerophosphodiester phosphodiesterase [Bdellovibrionales bacterium]
MNKDEVLSFAQRAIDLVMDRRSYPLSGRHRSPLIVAHRGAWNQGDCPENSMSAFRRAHHLGAWGIELDVRFTQDNVPLIQHDPNLQRLFGRPEVVAETPAAHLQKVAPSLATLKQVLELKGLHFMIEIKVPLTLAQWKILESHLIGLKPVQDYHFLTLNPKIVEESPFAPAASWILVGEIQLAKLVELSIGKGYGGVAGHYLTLTNRMIRRLHSAGQKTGVGFTPTKNLFQREKNREVDWVFTNSIEQLVR